MPRSNQPKKSKDSKKPSANQPHNRNRSSTTNNNGSAVQGGGGNTNNGSRNSTNGFRRTGTSGSNSSPPFARPGVGGGPGRSGGACRRFNLSDWLEETGATSSSAPHQGNNRNFDRHLQLTRAIAQKTLESQAMARRSLQAVERLAWDLEGLSIIDQHERRLSAIEEQLAQTNQANQQGNDTDSEEGLSIIDQHERRLNAIEEQLAQANQQGSDTDSEDEDSEDEESDDEEYLHSGVHSPQAFRRGNNRLFDRQMEVMKLIAQETVESQEMARRHLNAIEEQLAQANQQGSDIDSEDEDSDDEESEESDA